MLSHPHPSFYSIEDEEELGEKSESLPKKKKRPSRNREVVKKYREKKKAHTTYLEEEVKKMHLLNQQLLKILQGQASLEGEVAEMRALLFEFRGKIDNELGPFPYQKSCNVNFKEGDYTVQPLHSEFNPRYEIDMRCLHATSGSSSILGAHSSDTLRWEGVCEVANHDCPGFKQDADLSHHSVSAEGTGTSMDCVMPNTITSAGNLIAPMGLGSE